MSSPFSDSVSPSHLSTYYSFICLLSSAVIIIYSFILQNGDPKQLIIIHCYKATQWTSTEEWGFEPGSPRLHSETLTTALHWLLWGGCFGTLAVLNLSCKLWRIKSPSALLVGLVTMSLLSKAKTPLERTLFFTLSGSHSNQVQKTGSSVEEQAEIDRVLNWVGNIGRIPWSQLAIVVQGNSWKH